MKTIQVRYWLSMMALIAVGCGGGGGGGIDLPPGCESISSLIPTDVVEQDTTIPEGCWAVNEDINVSEAILTISPGATLMFAQNKGIEVVNDGVLAAVGTQAKPIVLTGQRSIRGYWNGVTFTNSPSFDNELTYVTVEYAGAKEMHDDGARAFRAGVSLDSSGYDVRATITHSTMRESSGYGLYLDGNAIVPDFTGNTITKNASGAAYTYYASTQYLTGDSTYTGNDVDLVFVNVAYDFGDPDLTWRALGVPYRVDGVYLLYSSLTIEAGTTLEFTTGAGIKALGFEAAIVAVGTVEKPIVFTGAAKTPGAWGGLYFLDTNDTGSTTPRSVLDHVVVEYGGGNIYAGGFSGNLVLDSGGWNSVVSLANSSVQYSSGYGVWRACKATLPGSGNTFSSNDLGDQGFEDNC